MSSEKQLTPEEKLLALIQHDKRQDPVAGTESQAGQPAAAPVPVAGPGGGSSAQVAERSAPAPAKAVDRAPAIPVPAAPVAAAPVHPAAGGERDIKTPSASVPTPVAAIAAEASPKLKLAASPLPSSARSQPAAAPARELPTTGPTAVEKPVLPAVVPAEASAPAPEQPDSTVPPPKAMRMPVNPLMSWPALNRILALVVLVLLVVVVYSVASIQTDVDKAMVKQVNEAGSLPAQSAGIEAVTPLPVDAYLNKVSGRDIFRLATVAGQASNVAPAAVEFKLVGVSMDGRDSKGSMAILRSKTSSQTFFVKVGDALGNTGYTLDRVLADRAILKKQKQEIEVR